MFDMLKCSLNFPDELWWRSEDNYNTYVGYLLCKADLEIRRGNHSAAAYQKALRLVQDWCDAVMSDRQRMHIYYLIAQARAALGESGDGINWIDEALSLAFNLDSDYDVGKLLSHRAAMNRSELLLARAAEDARDSLLVIDEHEEDIAPAEVVATRLHLLPQIASYEFYIADFDAARAHLDLARQLIAQTPNMALPAAATAWIQAHLDVLNRQAWLALGPSLQICEIYALQGNTTSYERAEILAAQVALALAQSLPVGTSRNLTIEMALPHITTAMHLAVTLHDQPGKALCMLQQAHYARLTNSNTNRKHLIGDVIQLAEDIGDIAALAQAHALLGEEYAASGDHERAKICYRMTLDLLRGSELPVLGFPARRALDEFDEFNDDDDDDD